MEFVKKYKLWFITGIVIVALSVVVQIFKVETIWVFTPWHRRWATHIYEYFRDWTIIIGAIGTLFLAGIALWTIVRSRRNKLASELNAWARVSLRLVIIGKIEDITPTFKTLIKYLKDIQNNLEAIDKEGFIILTAATRYSENMQAEVNDIISECKDVKSLKITEDNIEEVKDKIFNAIRSIGLTLLRIIDETS